MYMTLMCLVKQLASFLCTRVSYRIFSLTGMGEYTFVQVTPRNGATRIVVLFCRLVNKCSCLSFAEYNIAHGPVKT